MTRSTRIGIALLALLALGACQKTNPIYRDSEAIKAVERHRLATATYSGWNHEWSVTVWNDEISMSGKGDTFGRAYEDARRKAAEFCNGVHS